MLMGSRTLDPDRSVEGATLRTVIGRLARRIVIDSGGTKLRALADIRAAVEANIRDEIHGGGAIGAEELLDRVSYGANPERTWRQIGEDLGVSAQAAHRKYGPRSRLNDRATNQDQTVFS
jgi:hypothetical protein